MNCCNNNHIFYTAAVVTEVGDHNRSLGIDVPEMEIGLSPQHNNTQVIQQLSENIRDATGSGMNKTHLPKLDQQVTPNFFYRFCAGIIGATRNAIFRLQT